MITRRIAPMRSAPKNMCSVRLKPDALGAEAACRACVGHGLGIGADLHAADGVRPSVVKSSEGSG